MLGLDKDNPREMVKNIFLTSCESADSKRRKQARRTIRRVLDLALDRGLDQAEMDAITAYFATENAAQAPGKTKKILTSLFEYVSADEIIQLAQLGMSQQHPQ